eukprot:scaffold1623_cov165-Ochromonas_danica.AAC.9
MAAGDNGEVEGGNGNKVEGGSLTRSRGAPHFAGVTRGLDSSASSTLGGSGSEVVSWRGGVDEGGGGQVVVEGGGGGGGVRMCCSMRCMEVWSSMAWSTTKTKAVR